MSTVARQTLSQSENKQIVTQSTGWKSLSEHFFSLMAKCNRLRDIVTRCNSTGMLKKQPQHPWRSIYTRPKVKRNDNSLEYLEFNIDSVQSLFIADQDKENITMKLSFWQTDESKENEVNLNSIVVTFRWLSNEQEWYVTQVCEYIIFAHPTIWSENLTIWWCFDNEGNQYHFWATTVYDKIEHTLTIFNDIQIVQETIREFANYIAELKKQHLIQTKVE